MHSRFVQEMKGWPMQGNFVYCGFCVLFDLLASSGARCTLQGWRGLGLQREGDPAGGHLTSIQCYATMIDELQGCTGRTIHCMLSSHSSRLLCDGTTGCRVVAHKLSRAKHHDLSNHQGVSTITRFYSALQLTSGSKNNRDNKTLLQVIDVI
jgi:hypothetical protein